MVIYGIAKDQNGKEYFMVKNSWGLSGKYKASGMLPKLSLLYKTMNILVHKVLHRPKTSPRNWVLNNIFPETGTEKRKHYCHHSSPNPCIPYSSGYTRGDDYKSDDRIIGRHSFAVFNQLFVLQILAIHRQKIDYLVDSLFCHFTSGYFRYKIQQCLIYNAAKLHT